MTYLDQAVWQPYKERQPLNDHSFLPPRVHIYNPFDWNVSVINACLGLRSPTVYLLSLFHHLRWLTCPR